MRSALARLFNRWQAETSRNPPAGAGSKSPLAAVVKIHDGERKGKVPARPGQMCDRKLNESEPLMTCRKCDNEVKTAAVRVPR